MLFRSLDVFDTLYERSREDLVPLRASFRGRRDKQQIDAKISEALKSLEAEKSETSSLDDAHDTLSRKLAELRIITTGDASVEAAVKLRDLEKKHSTSLTSINTLQQQIQQDEEQVSRYKLKLEKFKRVKDAFSIEALRADQQKIRDLQSKIDAANRDIQYHTKLLTSLGQDVAILKTVPCGDEYPTCPFIKKAFESKSKVSDEQRALDELRLVAKTLQDEQNEIAAQNVDDKIKKYELMLQEERNILLDVGKIEVKVDHNTKTLTRQQEDYTDLSKEIDRLQAVVKDTDNLCGVYDSIKEIEEKIEKTRKDQLSNARSIGTFESSIETLRSEKEVLERDLADLEIYELFNVAMSKKGLPSRLISRLLPLVNEEIKNILLGVCNFTVELEVDEESNSLEIYINYGDKRRIIELGSGMEK